MRSDTTNPVIAISYSLPHIISVSADVVAGGYLDLLYINTYKWRPAQFGKLNSFFFLSVSICQFIFSLILQFFVVSSYEVNGLRNCKIIQIINISVATALPIFKMKYEARANALEGSKTDSDGDKPVNAFLSTVFNDKYFIFFVYFAAFLYASGWGSYEISNSLLPTFITRDSTYLSSTNDLIRGLSICTGVLVIIILNKILEKKYPRYMPFFGFTAFLLVLLIPVSVIFYVFTQKSSTGFAIDADDYVPKTANLDYPVLIGLIILQTAPIVIYFTIPVIIQFISTQYLNDNHTFRFYASTLYLFFFFLGAISYKAFSFIKLTKKTISYLTIACLSVGYLLFFPHRYSWNKNGLVHYVIISVFNIFIMIFVIITNIMATNQLADDNHKKYRWLLQGIIYISKNLIVAIITRLVYTLYDRELPLDEKGNGSEGHTVENPEDPESLTSRHDVQNVESGQNTNSDNKPVAISKFRLNFANTFRLIYFTFQVLNVISTFIYKEHVFE